MSDTKSTELFAGILPIKTKLIGSDIVAGLTLAVLAIPEVMGYATIAGMPVITGLYTLLVPMVLFAVFCSSRHLVVGADSATAAIFAGGVASIATIGSAQYIALAGILALMVAGLLVIARLIELGFLANFLSRTVLVGFLTGVGIQVALGQIHNILAVPADFNFMTQASLLWQQPQHLYSLLIALSALAIIYACKLLSKKIPGMLIAVVLITLLSWLFNFKEYGITVVGSVPSGLPHFSMPSLWTISWSEWQALLPIAFVLFLVILTQSTATARAYATRYEEAYDANKDLLGLAAANVGAALSGTFMVNGSPTKTEMLDGAGGRSQLAQLVTAGMVLLVLLFLTQALVNLPNALLASVVFVIGIELINGAEMKKIYRLQRNEFWVALITAVVVVVVGVQQGIILAMTLSLLVHTRQGYHPNNLVITKQANGNFETRPVNSLTQLVSGLVAYHFSHSLYYANAQLFMDEVVALTSKEQAVRWCFIDISAVDSVDYTAQATLSELKNRLDAEHIYLVFGQAIENMQSQSYTTFCRILGEDRYFSSIPNLITAYQKTETLNQANN